MLLTFKHKYDKLIDQTKPMSTRYNFDRWKYWLFNMAWKNKQRINNTAQDIQAFLDDSWEDLDWPPMLQMYWRNPRNGGLLMGEAVVRKFNQSTMNNFSIADARLDGFKTVRDYKEALIKTNHDKIMKDYCEMYIMAEIHPWAQISYEWVEGPFDVLNKIDVSPHPTFCGDLYTMCVKLGETYVNEHVCYRKPHVDKVHKCRNCNLTWVDK